MRKPLNTPPSLHSYRIPDSTLQLWSLVIWTSGTWVNWQRWNKDLVPAWGQTLNLCASAAPPGRKRSPDHFHVVICEVLLWTTCQPVNRHHNCHRCIKQHYNNVPETLSQRLMRQTMSQKTSITWAHIFPANRKTSVQSNNIAVGVEEKNVLRSEKDTGWSVDQRPNVWNEKFLRLIVFNVLEFERRQILCQGESKQISMTGYCESIDCTNL